MKFSALITFTLLLTLVILRGQTAEVKRYNPTITLSTRVQLVAEADPPKAKAGAQVFMNLRLKNISDKTVHLVNTDPNLDYRITVDDASGKEPPRTEWGDKVARGLIFSISQGQVDLEPGKEIQARVEITKWYQFARPDTFYARVNRGEEWVDADVGAGPDSRKFAWVVYSNPVEFTIVQ